MCIRDSYGTDAPFAGLGKLDPLGDPDSPDTYTLGSWQWESAEMFEKSLLCLLYTSRCV